MRNMLTTDSNDVEFAIGTGGLKGDFKMVAPGGQVFEQKRVTLVVLDPDFKAAIRLGLGAFIASMSLAASTLL